MKPEIKQKWVDALRSGVYQQTNGYLKRRDGFCCLGVLCDVVKDELNLEWQASDDIETFTEYIISNQASYLPIVVLNHCGINNVNPLVIYHGEPKFLAELNDSRISFDEIANIIEEQM